MLEQHQVELAAIHMVGVVLAHALFAFGEADVHMAIRGDSAKIHVVNLCVGSRSPGRAQLVRKLRFLHLWKEIEVFEHSSRRRDQRLSYVFPRHELLLEHHAVNAGFRQIGGHARSSGATSNNSYFKIGHRRIHSCCFSQGCFVQKAFVAVG